MRRYWTGSEWEPASVTVTGSDNPDIHVTGPSSGEASAYGPGLTHGVCGEPANFTVSTRVNIVKLGFSNPLILFYRVPEKEDLTSLWRVRARRTSP